MPNSLDNQKYRILNENKTLNVLWAVKCQSLTDEGLLNAYFKGYCKTESN